MMTEDKSEVGYRAAASMYFARHFVRKHGISSDMDPENRQLLYKVWRVSIVVQDNIENWVNLYPHTPEPDFEPHVVTDFSPILIRVAYATMVLRTPAGYEIEWKPGDPDSDPPESPALEVEADSLTSAKAGVKNAVDLIWKKHGWPAKVRNPDKTVERDTFFFFNWWCEGRLIASVGDGSEYEALDDQSYRDAVYKTRDRLGFTGTPPVR